MAAKVNTHIVPIQVLSVSLTTMTSSIRDTTSERKPSCRQSIVGRGITTGQRIGGIDSNSFPTTTVIIAVDNAEAISNDVGCRILEGSSRARLTRVNASISKPHARIQRILGWVLKRSTRIAPHWARACQGILNEEGVSQTLENIAMLEMKPT